MVALGQLLSRSRSYMLMAVHENGRWTFNPADDMQVGGGVNVVLMADPAERALAEEQVRNHR